VSLAAFAAAVRLGVPMPVIRAELALRRAVERRDNRRATRARWLKAGSKLQVVR
jgi:hypothetical protein